MGWLWSSSSEKDAHTSQASRSEAPVSIAPVAEAPARSAPISSQEPPKKLSRDEQAELEFQNLLKELNAPATRQETQPQSPSTPLGQQDEHSIHPTNLYPRNMSCRAAFDQAFYCQSMGGQFINVYRYGEMRSCSEHWSDFWFCMRTTKSGYGEETRVESLKKHHWEREKKYREGPSSEDIWQMRDKMVEGPFSADMTVVDKATEEYRESMKRRYRNFINNKPLDAPED